VELTKTKTYHPYSTCVPNKTKEIYGVLDNIALHKGIISRKSIDLIPDHNIMKKILLVDDEPYNLMGLKIIIEAADPENHILSIIDQARNGLEALDKVMDAEHDGTFQYGLIFMDCSMPIMDGYEASDRIRKFHA